MLTSTQKRAVVRSWELVEPIADTAADLFYTRLFELAPQYRAMFPADLHPQKLKLLKMLRFIVKSVDWPEDTWRDHVAEPEDLMLVVLALGRRHVELYRVPDEAYGTVGAALLWALDYGLGEAFTPETKEAWTQVYGTVAQTMRMSRFATERPDKVGRRTSNA